MAPRRAPQPRSAISCALRCAGALLLLIAGSGCVTFYQPMVSLQRPVAVDPRLPNFEGVKLLVRCIPGDDFTAGDADTLCRKLGTLFRNQGAEVDQEVPRDGRSRLHDADAVKPDLVLDVRSRRLHHEYNRALALLSAMTFTIIPTVEEESYEQEVIVRDGSGALLASDTYQARFTEYFGAGIYAVNGAADVFTRPSEEWVVTGAAQRDFSRDFYGQLSQLLFNARVRAQVLRGFEPPPPPPAPPSQLGVH